MIKFLIGGSPCTHWSIAQSKARETEPEGIGWELFKNYLIAKEKFSPDFFLYENNKSASQPIKERISVELGVPLQYINSALVSAQNRWRFYAHNIGDVPQPEDRGIMLIDILESVTGSEITPVYQFGDFDGKSYCLTSNYHKGSTIKQTLGHHKRTLAAERIELPAYAGRVVGRRINAEGHWDDYNHDLPHIQRFEVNNDPQKTNTISTAGKDNMIAVHVDGTSKQYPVYEVSGGFITYNGVSYEIALPDGYYIIRKLTVKECCRLQTMPDNYCRAVSDSRAYMGLGNGWTAEVTDPQEYRERRYEQKKALTECKTVLFLIELSFEKELISSEQCAEWTRHVMNVKNMTAKWRKQDRERFAALQQNRGITPRR